MVDRANHTAPFLLGMYRDMKLLLQKEHLHKANNSPANYVGQK